MSVSSLSERGERTRARPVYLGLGPDPVLAFLHQPAPTESSATAVVLCPTFGWDDTCSYRSRRAWADALADAGHPTARIDFPGSGDSGGSPRDAGRLDAWTEAVCAAAAWLGEASGCTRVAVIGVGLGGLVACRAAAECRSIDDLVLWAVPARGKSVVRELRAFARVADAEFPDPHEKPPPPAPEGFLNVAGFLLSDETLSEIAALDVATLELTALTDRRVLLLGRDRQPVDAQLHEHFERGGASVSVQAGDGYADLMTDPQRARVPRAVIALTTAWLAGAASGPPGPADAELSPPALRPPRPVDPPPPVRSRTELEAHGRPIRESVLRLELGAGSLFGVLTEPLADAASTCVVLPNAGAVRRIGPNRMWVEAARRWAARGASTFRFDLEGMGDSDGDADAYVSVHGLYEPRLTDQVLAIVDELHARGVAERFVLAGLCSGAYWSFHGALRDERVSAAFMINLYSFVWDEAAVREREVRRTMALVRSGGVSWLHEVTAARVWKVARTIPSRISLSARRRQASDPGQELDLALDRLRDAGKQALFLFSRGEPLYDDFVRTGRIDELDRWPGVQVECLPSRDHTFRAVWLQEHVHATLDRALERVLHGAAEPPELRSPETAR